MRIAFVTTDLERVRHADADRPLHERAFARAGIPLEYRSWRDPEVEWEAYDLVVVRSPWDYTERREEFAVWLDRLDAREPAVHLANPAAVIRWNLDKRYLLDLAERGVPVIPTELAESAAAADGLLEAHGDAEVAVKPVVSAGSRNTGRFRAHDPAARELARVILGEGLAVMVQPFARTVGRDGEASLVFFAGALSHAFRKAPILAPGGGFLGGAYREEISPLSPDAETRRAAEACDAAVRRHCAERLGVEGPLLYARYDFVRGDDGRAVLLEAELFEPAFFLHVDPDSPARFADAVRRRAEGR